MGGEMAGEPGYVPVLLGLGSDRAVHEHRERALVKSVVRTVSLADCRALFAELCTMATTAEIERRVALRTESCSRGSTCPSSSPPRVSLRARRSCANTRNADSVSIRWGRRRTAAGRAADPTTLVCPKCAQQLFGRRPLLPDRPLHLGGVHAVTAGMLARTPRSKQHLLGVTIGEAYIINGYPAPAARAVYRAEQRALARDVAIKVLMVDPEVDPAVISRFKREARTAASLLDPNVVTLFDYGETSLSDEENDRLLYFVMELVHGPTLRQYLRTLQRGVGLEASLKLGVNILRGLAAAHHMGVVHRDLKPGNVLIDESKGRKHFARLFDFGISSLQGSWGHTTWMGPGGGVVGTPKYMAPEQWRAQTTAPCTDVYAFGVIMAEMLLGQPPIPKMELAEMAAAHCRSPRPHVQQTAWRAGAPGADQLHQEVHGHRSPAAVRQRQGGAGRADGHRRGPRPRSHPDGDPLPGPRLPRSRGPRPCRGLPPGDSGSHPILRSGGAPACGRPVRRRLFDALAAPPERLSAPLGAGAAAVVARPSAEVLPVLEVLPEEPGRGRAIALIVAALLVVAALVWVLWAGADAPADDAGQRGRAADSRRAAAGRRA
ncbi:MAG: protein kinase [bacterium]